MANFAGRISEVAARMASRPAIEQLRADGRVETTTYGELDALAGRVGAWLISIGIASGDRVAILADNDARWIAAYLGALRIGAVAVPLDTAYKGRQVGTVLQNSGARLLFTTLRYLETAREGVTLAGIHTQLLLLSGESDAKTADAIETARVFDVQRAIPVVAPVGDSAAAVLLYTSGTTADPKGVVLTHANLDAERRAAFDAVSVSEHDALLGVLPLFHALAQMANLLLPLAVGARVVFLETVSSSSLVGALGSRGITIFVCVPQFFYLIHQRVMAEAGKKGAIAKGFLRTIIGANVWLRDHTGLNPAKPIFGRIHRSVGPSMRLFVTGGSKFDPAIRRDLYGLGFTILNAYGLTETSGGATITRLTDGFNESVGQPLLGVEVRIQEESSTPGVDLADDEHADGEVLIRGPIVMQEYFNRADATNEALQDGWLHTGDLGRLDDKGRLYITGRKKEIIVLSSGKNLYPEEIEEHYRGSAFIKELCVLGLSRPGEPSAERLHAVVVPDQDALRAKGIVNVKELIRFEIEGRSVTLPAHKRILSYDISMEPLPRTTTGKIRRHEIERRLRDRAASTDADTRPIADADAQWVADPEHRRVLDVIATRLDRPTVRPDANLELDLSLDSMERVELLTDLEQRAGTRVPAGVRATIFTVRQLVDAVRAAPAAETGSSNGAAMASDTGADLPWDQLLAKEPDRTVIDTLARPRRLRTWLMFALVKSVALVARGFVRFRYQGIDRLPASGPYILSPNHQTYVDPFFMAAALPYRQFRQLFFVGAAEYFETPFRKWFARTINLIPVDPDANLVTAMQAGAAGLRLGKILVLFPEGERSIDGELKKFRKGAPILSSHLSAPIVPVALDGLFELWPRGLPLQWRRLTPWKRPRVTYEFGSPMNVARGAYVEGTDELKARVNEMLTRIRVPQPRNPGT